MDHPDGPARRQALHRLAQARPIPGTALTTRLAALVDAGVLTKNRYSDRPVRYEYLLSARGRQVWPILISMWAWERNWVDDEDAVDLPHMRHTTCGEPPIPS
ncbi:winged helix-turn-helix transcriptional regulator [Aeromicrobium sp. UC242_57]|uniref:winged helix-turn-helix transcriptional regulator n=1 Tax=Aeromicrobium sp. UC242_57 TaxID=3374624 RepID=UPI00379BF075